MNSSPAIAPTSTRRIWLLTVGGFFSFFAFGFIDNLKGPTLPTLLRDVGLNYAQGGTILLGAYLGFLVATLATGVLADGLGNRTVLVLAGLLLSIGLLGYSLAGSMALLFVAMFVMGLGMGAIEVGGNGLIVELHRANRGRYLNLLAVFHGVGSLLVPLVAAGMLEAGFSWRQVFRGGLPLALVLLLFFALTSGPRRGPRGAEKVNWRLMARRGMAGSMIWFYVAIALYVCAELGVAAWIVEFLEQTKGLSLGRSSLYLSLFFACIMVGRLVGSLFVERIGYVRAIRFAGLAALLLLALGILGPAPLAILIPLSGLFFSIIFPTITALVSNQNPKNTGTILGFLFAAGGVGGALGPWAMGVVGDLAGIGWGFALPIAYFLGVVGALSMVRRGHTERSGDWEIG